nr:MAG TPA: hypothetical protein [Caudoviricetes sp.]
MNREIKFRGKRFSVRRHSKHKYIVVARCCCQRSRRRCRNYRQY